MERIRKRENTCENADPITFLGCGRPVPNARSAVHVGAATAAVCDDAACKSRRSMLLKKEGETSDDTGISKKLSFFQTRASAPQTKPFFLPSYP